MPAGRRVRILLSRAVGPSVSSSTEASHLPIGLGGAFGVAEYAVQTFPFEIRRLDDIAYTLCVATGARDIDTALVVARHRLPGGRPHDDSLVSA